MHSFLLFTVRETPVLRVDSCVHWSLFIDQLLPWSANLSSFPVSKFGSCAEPSILSREKRGIRWLFQLGLSCSPDKMTLPPWNTHGGELHRVPATGTAVSLKSPNRVVGSLLHRMNLLDVPSVPIIVKIWVQSLSKKTSAAWIQDAHLFRPLVFWKRIQYLQRMGTERNCSHYL